MFICDFLPGVAVVSWYPPGDGDQGGLNPDTLMPLILDAADQYQLKVTCPDEYFFLPFEFQNQVYKNCIACC